MLSTSVLLWAQEDGTQKKSEIKLGKLEVLYEEEEYEGVAAQVQYDDTVEAATFIYQPPYMVGPEDGESKMELIEVDMSDDGAESEDEILLEGFDTMAIHLPKLEPSSIHDPIVLDLSTFSWPTPQAARPSSHFGPRRRRFHYGLDLAQPTGEPIYAAFDGVVRISKYNRSYGNLVIIHHANGLETYYAHMSKRQVTAGDMVKSGQQIGLCGNTGRSFGSHLHFEIRYMGNAINPENVMDCSTHSLISPTLELTSNSFRKVAKGRSYSKGGSSGNCWYRVRSGDNLSNIAKRNGTTVQRLCQLNGISRNKPLQVGQRIKVCGSTGSSKASDSGKGSSKSASSSAATHVVRSGETLYSIARANGTTVKALCKLNGISERSVIKAGQKLKVK